MPMYGPQYLRRLALEEESKQPSLETVQRDSEYMQEACKNSVPQFGSGVRRFPMDGSKQKKAYHCLTEEGIKKFMEYDWTDTREYIRQKYDCENFAISFVAHLSEMYRANNVGVVLDWSSAHAYVAFVPPKADQPTLKLIEPQSDEILDPGADDMHLLEEGVILL